MRKIFILLFFILNTNLVNAETIIAYLDVQFIMDNSKLGLKYKEEIIKYQKEINVNVKKIENNLKKKENEINNQKNVLNQDEINKKINELNKLLKNYQDQRKKFNKDLLDKKNLYSTNILKVLNPLLTNYVQNNKISILIEKKNVLVGVKTLDITKDILLILDQETEKKNLINEN